MTLTLGELRDLIIIENGETIVDDIEISPKDLKKVLENHVLTEVGRFRPIRKVINIYIAQPPFRFTGTEVDVLTGAPAIGIPDWVSDVGIIMTSTPNTITAVIPQMFRQESRSRLWLYDKPLLYTFMFGQLSVQACYYPILANTNPTAAEVVTESGDVLITEEQLTVTTDTDENLAVWTIQNLDEKAQMLLVQLTTGYLLQAIGMARRKVNFGDFPIVTDANQLVEQGTSLIQKTMADLERKQAWWLSV